MSCVWLQGRLVACSLGYISKDQMHIHMLLCFSLSPKNKASRGSVIYFGKG